MNFAATAEATVKFVFDVARLVPGLSWLLGWEPVVVDGLALASLVEADAVALMATPEWARFIASASTLIKSKGGNVVFQSVSSGGGTVITGYVSPPHESPTQFNANPPNR